MIRKLLALIPVVAWIIWVPAADIKGASIWAGAFVAFFAFLGLARMLGLNEKGGIAK